MLGTDIASGINSHVVGFFMGAGCASWAFILQEAEVGTVSEAEKRGASLAEIAKIGYGKARC